MADRNYMHVCMCVFGVQHVIFLNSSYFFFFIFCGSLNHAAIRIRENCTEKTENLKRLSDVLLSLATLERSRYRSLWTNVKRKLI